jgi:uncharacterized protein (TIGR03067 family)
MMDRDLQQCHLAEWASKMQPGIIVVVFLFGAIATAHPDKADGLSKDAKKELEKLQGEWVLKEGQRSGTKFEENDDKLILEIKGGRWFFTGQEKGEFVAISPDADPKCFDLKSMEPATKGRVHEGIYKIDGDTLTICIHEGKEKNRPGRFGTTADEPNTILTVFKRVKKE